MARTPKKVMQTLPAEIFRTTPELAQDFRARHNLAQGELDRLLGFTSKGRAARRWERDGAPPYVEVIMAYIDKYGTDVALRIADKRDQMNADASAEA